MIKQMPLKVDELNPIEKRILQILENGVGYAYSSRELAEDLEIAHSTARKHLKILYDRGVVRRGKKKEFNRTFFYYMENVK